MLKREELSSMEIEVLGEKLQASINEEKAKVDAMESVDEILMLEQDLMADMKEYDTYLDGVKYIMLPESTYEGVTYDKTKIAEFVVEFLNKLEVEFQMTLGMHQLVTLWKEAPNAVDYRAYDSTLRCLAQVKFKGDEEWTKILAANDYLSAVHENYSRDTSYLIYISQIHNNMMERMQKLSAPEEEVVNE